MMEDIRQVVAQRDYRFSILVNIKNENGEATEKQELVGPALKILL